MEAAEGVIMDDEDDAETVAEPECDMDTESVEGVPGTEQTIEVDDDDDEETRMMTNVNLRSSMTPL